MPRYEEARCPSTDEWIKQLWDIYTLEYYSAIKKEENFTFYDSMDGPGEYYAKWNKPVRERQIAYDFTHNVESNQQTELTSKIETDS